MSREDNGVSQRLWINQARLFTSSVWADGKAIEVIVMDLLTSGCLGKGTVGLKRMKSYFGFGKALFDLMRRLVAFIDT